MDDSPTYTDDDGDGDPLSVIDLLDRIEGLINGSRRVPLTPNIVVNEEEILDALDQIRMALPDEIKEARLLIEERDVRLREASQEAEQLVAVAQERAERLVDDHEIARRAASEAEQMMTEARERSRRVRREADEYVRGTMEELEAHLTATLQTVRKGLETLDDRPGDEEGGRTRRGGRRRRS